MTSLRGLHAASTKFFVHSLSYIAAKLHQLQRLKFASGLSVSGFEKDGCILLMDHEHRGPPGQSNPLFEHGARCIPYCASRLPIMPCYFRSS